ncbi:hypothetical protein LguiA_033002 [Lonicera macranthoides]
MMNQIQRSPPKHRHDGTSPLPLGMDWSPPPRKWNGRDTVWPHDPRTGWSYCINIPSWVVLPKSRDSDPVVFYRVQVGLQSPEGVTTIRGILRRFNDFLKLYTALKKAYPKKNLPPAPPKGLLRMKSRALLEERRRALEEWMTKLLSDIDISRSIAVASFLELEAAARSSFQDENPRTDEANSSTNTINSSLRVHTSPSPSVLAGSTSLTSDYGSDTAYETSEIETPSLGRDNNSEIATEDLSMDEELTSPIEKLVKYGMSNIDEGLFMGQAILEQLEGFPRHRMHAREINEILENNSIHNGNASTSSKAIGHVRKLSNESVGSEVSSLRGSESSYVGFPNNFGDGPTELSRGAEVSKATDAQLVLPLDQQQKMNKVLVSMQRRLVTAKTDMEDLISRLNNEIAVKDYLTTKVKDLEVELETTKQKSKENLEQAILIERERFTQMQWDMEELRQKSLEMELRLKSRQDKNPHSELTEVSVVEGKDMVQKELDTTKQQLEYLVKQHQEMEAKSKADIKVLVKEVKSLRSSQVDLKQKLQQSLNEKSEAEGLLQQEKEKNKNAKTARRKLLHDCELLRNRLQECNINLFDEKEDNKLVLNSSSLPDVLNLLATSDNQISLLFAEVGAITPDGDYTASAVDKTDDDTLTIDHELRKMLSEIFKDNARLRKQVNSVIRRTLRTEISCEKNGDEDPSKGIVGDTSLER